MFYHVKILYSAKIITELVFIKNKKINTSIFYNYQLCFLTNPISILKFLIFSSLFHAHVLKDPKLQN
jgi:hypothetical protein